MGNTKRHLSKLFRGRPPGGLQDGGARLNAACFTAVTSPSPGAGLTARHFAKWPTKQGSVSSSAPCPGSPRQIRAGYV
ncbi:hypothetical protein E2C01_054863 [Portunus trituberculatus]|uniref:Uncharacterized protein n=1 Tax=Portunus trituberculatus TaxID=210409 RepID=A0A5B7GTB7_PORTR|nr:hypothetical protein [Portunus trituberculatus]